MYTYTYMISYTITMTYHTIQYTILSCTILYEQYHMIYYTTRYAIYYMYFMLFNTIRVFSGPETGKRKRVTRAAGGKLPLMVDFGGSWHE